MSLMASSRFLGESRGNIQILLIRNFLTSWKSKHQIEEKSIDLPHFGRLITMYYYSFIPHCIPKRFSHQDKKKAQLLN